MIRLLQNHTTENYKHKLSFCFFFRSHILQIYITNTFAKTHCKEMCLSSTSDNWSWLVPTKLYHEPLIFVSWNKDKRSHHPQKTPGPKAIAAAIQFTTFSSPFNNSFDSCDIGTGTRFSPQISSRPVSLGLSTNEEQGWLWNCVLRGTGPSRWLWEKLMADKKDSLPSSLGICPDSWLRDRSNASRFFKFANDEGTLLANALPDKLRNFSKLEIEQKLSSREEDDEVSRGFRNEYYLCSS